MVIGTNALLTTTIEAQKRLEEELAKAGLKNRRKSMVGGAPVTQRWADRIQADAFAEHAGEAAQQAKALLGTDLKRSVQEDSPHVQQDLKEHPELIQGE